MFRPIIARLARPVHARRDVTSDSRQLMFRPFNRGIVPLCLLLLAGCASSAPTLDLHAPEAEQALIPGDIVKVVVWREEDLTGEFMVDRNGHVVLPRVGRWDVRGETESSLEERLTDALREDLRNATVDVILLRRIQVLGAVVTPGLYPLDNTMTLGDALATAGGVAPTGQRDRIDIIRGDERYVIEMDRDRLLTDLALRSGDSVYVPEKHWLALNYTAVFTAASSLAGLLAVILSISNR